MSISEPFIRRPVATTLLMIGLLLAGIVGFRQLPVSALPQVDYPTIQVATYLPGASAETMVSAVTTPLERQFGQMPALAQMTSAAGIPVRIIVIMKIRGPIQISPRMPRAIALAETPPDESQGAITQA